MKLDFSGRKARKITNMWTSNNTQQTTSGLKKKSQEIIEHILRQMKTETRHTKLMRHSKELQRETFKAINIKKNK